MNGAASLLPLYASMSRTESTSPFYLLQLSKCNDVCSDASREAINKCAFIHHSRLQQKHKTRMGSTIRALSHSSILSKEEHWAQTLPVNLRCTYVTPSFTSPKTVGTYRSVSCLNSGVPRNFVRRGWGESSTNSVEGRGQRERESGDSSPLVRGSGGSCNFVQEISFHTVKFS
jgi:hypothetical protein